MVFLNIHDEIRTIMVSHKDPLCSRNIIAFEWQVQIMAIKGLFKVKLPPTACSSSLVIINPISLLAFMEFIQFIRVLFIHGSQFVCTKYLLDISLPI